MNKYILLAITALCLQDMQAQTVVHPSIKTKTTFAIVVDQKSYDEAKSEIDAYRTSIEKEGLGTYLLIDDWKRPEPIREQLVKLHENEKTPLEGCVFIGDIPIPMIRDAHHLSSAFKRSPKANWQKSSVPSDRYYDDFGLKVSIRPTTGIKPLYTTIATVTMNLIVSAAIVLLNPYVTIYISYKIPPFALSVHIPDVSTSIYVEVDSKVLLGLPFCDKAFVR